VQLVRLKVAGQAVVDAITLHAARREVIADLLDALLPPRRDRHCERVKKPAKNTFAVKKRGQPVTSSNVRYVLKVTRHLLPPAQTP